MKYVRLEEYNDWEGETWNFYIPVVGNEEGLKKIKEKLDEDPQHEDCPVKLFDDVYEEDEVDSLVKMSECGYMHQHNKMSGIINWERFHDIFIDDFLELIYKGQLDNIGLHVVRS